MKGNCILFAVTLVTLLAGSNYTMAQERITVSGYISEHQSGERLIGATVFIASMNAGAVSNDYGFYSLTVPANKDSMDLSITYVGYAPCHKKIVATKNLKLDVALERSNTMKEVVVTANKEEAFHRQAQMSKIDLPIETIKSLPALFGEADIMKAVQLLPGVQAGTEGSTGIFVRGGGPDQNLILLDGVPVYNVSHLFGFMSVFNTDAIRNVEIYKGGFPARYGGRLSSVLDIKMKEGNKDKFHGEGGIGLIASRLTLEGPIQKGKSSFMVSGRRTYADLLAQPFVKASSKGGKAGYFFYDLNGKLNFQLGKKDHLYISGYWGRDKAYFNAKPEASENVRANLSWGNITAVARWNHQYNPKLFGNLTTYYSQYNFLLSNQQTGDDNYAFMTKFTSGVHDKAVKYDLDFIPGPNHYFRMGAGLVSHTYKPGASHTKVDVAFAAQDITQSTPPVYAQEYDAYMEDDIRLSDRLKANIGLHFTAFNVRKSWFTSLQPRISAAYMINDKLSAKASYVQMNQFIHLLSNSSIGLPTDLWVPVTDRIPKQTSHQFAAGMAYSHPAGFEISLEGYYKKMNNVLEYKEGASYLNTEDDWENKVEIGDAWSRGIELFVQKKKGRLTGMAGYSYSRTTRQFDNLNNGASFPYKYDRRHEFKVAAAYEVSKKITLGMDWVYGTGNALTMPVAVQDVGSGRDRPVLTRPVLVQGTGNDDQAYIYGERNAYRMAPYHRADISIKFSKQKKWHERAWIFGAYNVYNRANPLYIYSAIKDGRAQFKQLSLYRLVPYITYQFKF